MIRQLPPQNYAKWKQLWRHNGLPMALRWMWSEVWASVFLVNPHMLKQNGPLDTFIYNREKIVKKLLLSSFCLIDSSCYNRQLIQNWYNSSFINSTSPLRGDWQSLAASQKGESLKLAEHSSSRKCCAQEENAMHTFWVWKHLDIVCLVRTQRCRECKTKQKTVSRSMIKATQLFLHILVFEDWHYFAKWHKIWEREDLNLSFLTPGNRDQRGSAPSLASPHVPLSGSWRKG